MSENIVTNPMTPEEVEHMKLVFNSARNSINKTVDDLKQIVFTYEQYMTANKFEEAEALMAKIASMSVACQAWNLVKNQLDDFADPYSAIAEGLIALEDYHNKSRRG